MGILPDWDAARNAIAELRPSTITVYLDGVWIWLLQPLTDQQRRRLERQCHHLRVEDGPAWFNHELRQYLQVTRPNQEAMRFLSRRPHHLSHYQVAVDWSITDPEEHAKVDKAVQLCLIKRWHRNAQVYQIEATSYFSENLRAANLLLTYGDKFNRHTGECHTVHIEWRTQSRAAVKRSGIENLDDLIKLDLREFLRDKLKFAVPNIEKLGQRNHRYIKGKGNRRGAHSYYRKIGEQLLTRLQARLEAEGKQLSTQRIIDAHRGQFRVSECLEQIEIGHLIPLLEENAGQSTEVEARKGIWIDGHHKDSGDSLELIWQMTWENPKIKLDELRTRTRQQNYQIPDFVLIETKNQFLDVCQFLRLNDCLITR